MAVDAGTGEAASLPEEISASGDWSALPAGNGQHDAQAAVEASIRDSQALQIEHLQAWASRMSDLVIYLSHGINNLAARMDEMDQRLQAAAVLREQEECSPEDLESGLEPGESLLPEVKHLLMADVEASIEDEAPKFIPTMTMDLMAREGLSARHAASGTEVNVDESRRPIGIIADVPRKPIKAECEAETHGVWELPQPRVQVHQVRSEAKKHAVWKLPQPRVQVHHARVRSHQASSSSQLEDFSTHIIPQKMPTLVDEVGLEFALAAVQDLRQQLLKDRGDAASRVAAAAVGARSSDFQL